MPRKVTLLAIATAGGLVALGTSASIAEPRPDTALGASTASAPVEGNLTASGPGENVSPEHKEFKRNARGESFGSALSAAAPEDEPDLIAAVATNGKSGYIRSSEMEAADPLPKSPAEAAKNLPPVKSEIPVYASDGVTVVGAFSIGGGTR